VKASTVYGNVTLNSEKEFSIKAGANSSPTEITTKEGNQFEFPATFAAAKDITFNFNGKIGTFSSGTTAASAAANFATALNELAGAGGKIAYIAGDTVTKAVSPKSVSGDKTITLSADSVKGLTPGMPIKEVGGIAAGTTIEKIEGTIVTLSKPANADVTTITTGVAPAAGSVYVASASGASITFTAPSSDYKPTATKVTTIADTEFLSTSQVKAKDPTNSNLSDLGFEPGAVIAKNIGRLNFQVGPAANQLISIDLADFGKNGDITGPITSDKAPTNLLTVQSANDVIMNVNKSLDRIAATRATMGAVMNRLTHVIDNLTNVVMNSESSRSQIEDADYAKASTELARTQIMQQAATAVLAQANTAQQTVLKLLQG
jgi:flagellin